MKLDRIYTRSGDDGRTSLGDGARLPKFHVRVAAYGSIDEANSAIGIAVLHIEDAVVRDVLTHVQNDLFDLGGDLCRPEREHRKVEPLRISERQVTWIEERIDLFNAALAPLDSFVLPGGTHAAAHLHHARTVVRRAERYMTEIAYQEPVNPAALRYANRLSDLLFVLARYVNERGRADVLWRPGLHLITRTPMTSADFTTPAEIRYFEDYLPGTVFESGHIPVNEAEIIEFARRYDPQDMHVDPEAAAGGRFGGLVASGWHTAAMVMRLIAENFLSKGTSLASPGIDELRWLKPVRPGDVLRIRVTVVEATPSRSRSDRGMVRSLVEALNQDGDVVMSMKPMNIIRRRDQP